ncbi:30S ribosomal protein S2, partial [bacterium]|nr:30S ribosomal protein S2 [bacterium]
MTKTTPTINDLFGAGVHFGHQTNKWNPQMAKYIHSSSLGVHIIDL